MIWVFAELRNGALAKVTLELLGKALELNRCSLSPIASILVGSDVQPLAQELIGYGVDQVYVAENPCLANYESEPYAEVVAALIKQYSPDVFLLGATDIGLDLAPRVAAKLGTGLTAHCVGLQIEIVEGKSCLHQMVPVWGSGVMADMICPVKRPQMATVKPGIFSVAIPAGKREGKISRVPVTIEEKYFRAKVVEKIPAKSTGLPIEEAERIIAVGWGVHAAGVFPQVQKLAEALHAEIAATRPMVDHGYVPEDNMIGQSGKIVSPRLFISLGASGAMHFTSGFMKSKYIVAVDQNPEAPIFRMANLGIVGELSGLLPCLYDKVSGLDVVL